MKTSDFDFDLPEELIAQEPAEQRGTSRMLILDRSNDSIEHKSVSDIADYLEPGDLLVMNNTKVFPARLLGRRQGTGGKVELLLVEKEEELTPQLSVWDCFLKARKRPPVGSILEFGEGRILAEVKEVRGERVSVELTANKPLFDALEEIGVPPVPPYIRRDYRSEAVDGVTDELVRLDRDRYQTVYAKHRGSVAAPTAGLHFTDAILSALSSKGVNLAEVTLHVGPGTFKPVTAETVEEHVMESEWYHVDANTAELINHTKKSGGRVVAVGSTTVRTLETIAKLDGAIEPGDGRSSMYIYPPYNFKVVDAMLTNFHLPRSSLLMMVSALAGGRELVLEAYKDAIKEKYRFYSYGDCMLLV